MSDSRATENGWSYLDDECRKYNLIWLIKDFTLQQQEHKKKQDYKICIRIPGIKISVPDNQLCSKVYLDDIKESKWSIELYPYRIEESREAYLSCRLRCLGPDSLFHAFICRRKPNANDHVPIEGTFTVTVINFSGVDVHAKMTFGFHLHSHHSPMFSSYIHKILPLIETDKFLLNDTLTLKISFTLSEDSGVKFLS